MNWSEFILKIENGELGERYSDLELANKIGIGRELVFKLKTGVTDRPQQSTIKKIERGLNIKIDTTDLDDITYTRIEDKKDDAMLEGAGAVYYYPVLATVYAGEAEMLDHQVHERSEPYTYNKNGHRCYSLLVSGKSMETTLKDGDTVLVDMDIALENGCLVAVKLKGGQQYIKRYYDLNYAFIKLTSDNPEYGVRLIDKNDIVACHRIVQINLSV